MARRILELKSRFVFKLIRAAIVAAAPFLALSGASASEKQNLFITYAAGKYALVDARVIDPSSRRVHENWAILIDNETITYAGPSSAAETDGYSIVDLDGKSVLPGMIFMHEHTFYPVGGPKPNSPSYQGPLIPRLLIASGITTARTAGTVYPMQDLALAKAIQTGKAIGPDMDITMPFIDSAPTCIFGIREVDSAQEAKEQVAFWSDAGATSVKIFMNASRAVTKDTLLEAHARGLKVTGHICAVTFREAAELGIDNLEHGFGSASDFSPGKEIDKCPRSRKQFPSPDDKDVQSLIKTLIDNDVTITLTPGVSERSGAYAPPLDELSRSLLTPEALKQHLRFRTIISGIDKGKLDRDASRNERIWAINKAFADAGGQLMVGTDVSGSGGCVVGPCSHRSLELLVEYGFEPMDVLRMVTVNAAQYLEREQIGKVQSGYQADLVIIDGKPDLAMPDIRNVVTTFRKGVGYNPEALIKSAEGRIGS